MARQTKIVGVSFFPETLDAITKAAKSDRRSRSSWITLACEEKLERDAREPQAETITTKRTPSPNKK